MIRSNKLAFSLFKSSPVFFANIRNLSATAAPKAAAEKLTPKKRHPTRLGPVSVHEAVELAKQHKWAKFDETVEICILTGLDPRKPNQAIKGIAKLPFGSGKKQRIAVIAGPNEAKAALDAGADIAGSDEVIAAIQAGDVNFTAVIATPDMMPAVGKIGRILGPRGLMPNPKLGTVTTDVSKAVKNAKAGSVQYKTEKEGGILAGIGKISFSNENILENVRAFMLSIMDNKPEGFKGKLVKKVYMSTTMGPGIEVELGTIDPNSPRFMLKLEAGKQ